MYELTFATIDFGFGGNTLQQESILGLVDTQSNPTLRQLVTDLQQHDEPTQEQVYRTAEQEHQSYTNTGIQFDSRSTEIPTPLDDFQLIKNCVSNVLTQLLESDRTSISWAEILTMIIGENKVTKELKESIIESINQDGRLEYYNSGSYVVRNIESPPITSRADRDEDPCSELEQIITTLLPTLRHRDGVVKHSWVLGALNRAGVRLEYHQFHDFNRILCEHPDIVALPDGSFFIKNASVKLDIQQLQITKDETDPKQEFANKNGKPLSQGQIKRAIDEINRSDGVRRARLNALPANTRKHGKNFRRKGSLVMGKAHGKKKTFEQLVQEINKRENKQ